MIYLALDFLIEKNVKEHDLAIILIECIDIFAYKISDDHRAKFFGKLHQWLTESGQKAEENILYSTLANFYTMSNP